MSNQNRAAGLIPNKAFGGGTPQRTSEYEIAGGYDTDIYTGDLVKATGEGLEIAKAATGERVTGVFAGCQWTDASGAIQYSRFWPGNQQVLEGTKASALVYDDPNILFEVQASGDLTAADVRAVADIVDDVDASTDHRATGTSGVQLDSTTVATSGNKQLKVMGLSDTFDNEYGEYAKVIVKINLHELAASGSAV